MSVPNQCKTQRCTRNSIPESFGFCNICFAKIIEVRKVKALESIAKSLKLLNLPDIILKQESNSKIDHHHVDPLPLQQKKKTTCGDDFIPSMDISKIKSTNIKVQTKTNKKDLKEISNKLKHL